MTTGNPHKKNSLNVLSRTGAANIDSPFPSRPPSDNDDDTEDDSTLRDMSAQPSLVGIGKHGNGKDRDPRSFSAMAVDGSALPSQNQLMQNYGPLGIGGGRVKGVKRAKVDTEDWVHHDIKSREKDNGRSEMEQVVEEHAMMDEGNFDDIKDDEVKEALPRDAVDGETKWQDQGRQEGEGAA
jgi:hypothetical protein